ncbi:hypothetical protein N836_16525 [Leptolyngbya sp. Heron Island J]|nr:hypothetical protein N836_16525 [Leptolyngbya sp. Heron Island J]
MEGLLADCQQAFLEQIFWRLLLTSFARLIIFL